MEDIKITHEVKLDCLIQPGAAENSQRQLVPCLRDPVSEPDINYHALDFEWCISNFSDYTGILESCNFLLERCSVVWRFEMKFTKSQATSKDVIELEFIRNSIQFSPIEVMYVLTIENTDGDKMGPFAGHVIYGSTTMANVLAFGWRPTKPSDGAESAKGGNMKLPDDVLIIKGKLKFVGCCPELILKEDSD